MMLYSMERQKPYLGMVLIQVLWAGTFLINKAAFDRGLNTFVFTLYRQVFASILLAPFTIVHERKKKTPNVSRKVLCKIFMLAFLGITITLTLSMLALRYTSPTLVAATTNTIPVFTFLWAILFRMEVVKLKTLAGNAKVVGVLACIAGIIVLAIYKGPTLKFLSHFEQSKEKINNDPVSSDHPSQHWVLGTVFHVIANAVYCLWIVLQGQFLRDFPAELLFTTLQCCFSSVQLFVVAIVFERNFSHWKLGLDIGLLAVAYCGIVSSTTYYLQAWCIRKKGPVFTAMFTPLSLVLTTILSKILFGETLIYLGRVLGGVLLVIGLYCVLWGKKEEEKVRKLAGEEENNCASVVSQ